MPEVECPSCGGFGTIPKDKVNDRLVCRKCHVVFHVTPAGRSVLGEPKAEAEAHPHGHPHAHGAAGQGAGGGFTLSPRTAQVGAGVVVAALLLYFVGRPLLGSGKSLEATARGSRSKWPRATTSRSGRRPPRIRFRTQTCGS